MASLHLSRDFVLIDWIPYYAKIKNDNRDPQPITKARTSAEAVREFAKVNRCPRGSIVQIFTPDTLRTGKASFEHKLREYRKPRLR